MTAGRPDGVGAWPRPRGYEHWEALAPGTPLARSSRPSCPRRAAWPCGSARHPGPVTPRLRSAPAAEARQAEPSPRRRCRGRAARPGPAWSPRVRFLPVQSQLAYSRPVQPSLGHCLSRPSPARYDLPGGSAASAASPGSSACRASAASPAGSAPLSAAPLASRVHPAGPRHRPAVAPFPAAGHQHGARPARLLAPNPGSAAGGRLAARRSDPARLRSRSHAADPRHSVATQ